MSRTTDEPNDRAPETTTAEKKEPYRGFGRDLAPCPFCGGKVELYRRDERGGQHCGISDPAIACKTCGVTFFENRYSSQMRLLRAWGERPIEEALQTAIDEQRENEQEIVSTLTAERDRYQRELATVNKALNGHADEIVRLTAELATANDYRYELKTVIEAMKLATESRDLQIASLQVQLNEMRDHRDRWYAAAGQRQNELNEAHQVIEWMTRGLLLDASSLPAHLQPPEIVARHVRIARQQFSGFIKRPDDKEKQP